MTDWDRVRRLTDHDIEKTVESDPDAAPILDVEWFRNATIVFPQRKVPVSIRLDKEVVHWFRRQGRGYQSHINAVLKSYFEVQSGKAAPRGAARKRRTATKKPKRRLRTRALR